MSQRTSGTSSSNSSYSQSSWASNTNKPLPHIPLPPLRPDTPPKRNFSVKSLSNVLARSLSTQDVPGSPSRRGSVDSKGRSSIGSRLSSLTSLLSPSSESEVVDSEVIDEAHKPTAPPPPISPYPCFHSSRNQTLQEYAVHLSPKYFDCEIDSGHPNSERRNTKLLLHLQTRLTYHDFGPSPPKRVLYVSLGEQTWLAQASQTWKV